MTRSGFRCILQAYALFLVAGGAGAERSIVLRPQRGFTREHAEARAPDATPSRGRTTLLVVGDSLVGGPVGFAKALRKHFHARRVRVVEDTWVGVGIQRFAANSRLRELVARHRPTHVFVVLGTNDYLLPTPDRAASAVERIVARTAAAVAIHTNVELVEPEPGGDRPQPPRCAWIGPLVQKDTGIVRVIADHTAPCRFLDSRRFGVPTVRDGFHPTVPGAVLWAEGVLDELTAAGWTWEP